MKKTVQSLSLFSTLLVLLISNVSAQDFWMQRSYQRWTKDEIVRLISDSPWSQVREREATTTSGGTIPSVTVRLRSAVPIRQALVRLKQLDTNYDKMDAAKRAEFDEKMKGTLECPACQENYVVTISPPVSNQRLTSGVYGLKSATMKLLKGKVYLINDKGEKRDLAFFVAPKNDDDEAVFYFPRKDDQGNLFLTNKNEKFTFVFDADNIPITGGAVTTERRMVVDGTTPVVGTDTVNLSTKGRTVPRQVVFDVKRLLIDEIPEF